MEFDQMPWIWNLSLYFLIPYFSTLVPQSDTYLCASLTYLSMDFPKALGKLNKLFVIVFLQFGAVWKIPDWFSARQCSFNPNKVQALKKCSDEPLIKLTLQSIFPGLARLGWLLVLEFVKCSRLLSLWIILSEARDGPGLGFLPGYMSVPHSRAVKMKAKEIKESAQGIL